MIHELVVNSPYTGLESRKGQTVTVVSDRISALFEDDRVLQVRFGDGTETEVFASELDAVPLTDTEDAVPYPEDGRKPWEDSYQYYGHQ